MEEFGPEELVVLVPRDDLAMYGEAAELAGVSVSPIALYEGNRIAPEVKELWGSLAVDGEEVVTKTAIEGHWYALSGEVTPLRLLGDLASLSHMCEVIQWRKKSKG